MVEITIRPVLVHLMDCALLSASPFEASYEIKILSGSPNDFAAIGMSRQQMSKMPWRMGKLRDTG